MTRARQMGFRTNMPLFYGSGEEFSSLKAVPTTAAGHGVTWSFLGDGSEDGE
jgi:hypothetical protein